MKLKATLGILCALSLQSAYAQKRIYVNEYLNIGVGARGLAMSNAVSASSSDVTSAYWNPAGLMNIKQDYQVGLMHAEYFSGNAKYDYASVAMPLKDKKRTLGFTVMRFAIDDIPNTIDYVQPDGSFDESKLKSMTAGDYAFLLSYAQGINLFKNNTEIQTSIGGNAKVIYRHLGKMATAWGLGIDLGIQGKYKEWRFGITAKDITTTYTSWSFNLSEKDKEVFQKTGNEIPIKSYEVMLPRLNFGLSRYFLPSDNKFQFLAELGFDMTTDGKRNTLISSKAVSVDPRLGLEGSYKNMIFLRGGVGNFQSVLDDADTTNQKKVLLFSPSVGLGLKLKGFVVDYAFTSLLTQSNPLYTHIISLRVDLFKGATRREMDGSEQEYDNRNP
ncbi:MAG: PorV/PorQ family protein [Flavipsychrobacter sp.]|nr:PorV/PorQ family protein [Flavipsychrobacter sp.]